MLKSQFVHSDFVAEMKSFQILKLIAMHQIQNTSGMCCPGLVTSGSLEKKLVSQFAFNIIYNSMYGNAT